MIIDTDSVLPILPEDGNDVSNLVRMLLIPDEIRVSKLFNF